MNWQYKTEIIALPGKIEMKLNALGKEGWELVCVCRGDLFVFKRKMADS